MNDFKEWLSDYLRYFMLAAAFLLLFGIIMIGTNVYRSMQQKDDQEVIQILTETEQESEAQTEIQSESKHTVLSESDEEPETVVQAETPLETEVKIENETEAETELETESETEIETETEYVPKYKTLIGSCYIRSAPSMEAEIMGEYIYGTTVEFIEDVGGWYKVQIDGMTGYMGARFFED